MTAVIYVATGLFMKKKIQKKKKKLVRNDRKSLGGIT